ALCRRYRHPLDLAALQRADRRRRVHDGHGYLPRHYRAHRVAAALVGGVREPGAGLLIEELGGELERRRARGIVDFARPRLRVVDQLLHGVHRQRGVDDEYQREVSDHRDLREIPERRIGQLRVDRRIHGHRPARAHEQRIAVGGGLGDVFGGDDALRAGLVLDDDRLAEAFGHLGREDAHDDVVAAAGRGRAGAVPWYDAAAAVAGGAASAYLAIRYASLSELTSKQPWDGLLAAGVLLVLFLEGLRRTSGSALFYATLAFLALAMS